MPAPSRLWCWAAKDPLHSDPNLRGLLRSLAAIDPGQDIGQWVGSITDTAKIRTPSDLFVLDTGKGQGSRGIFPTVKEGWTNTRKSMDILKNLEIRFGASERIRPKG
jgi:hypothetical protein